MSQKTQTNPAREVVGLLADRAAFDAAIAALQDAGFGHADISILSSHSPLEAAGESGTTWRDALTAMVGEIRYEGPLVASGAVMLAGGPMAASIAALIGAATASVAAAEVIGEVTSTPNSEEFARSLAAGSIIIWVRAEDRDAEIKADAALSAAGATNVHLHDPETEG